MYKKKAPLSTLNRFNKIYNKADSSKICMLACEDSHYELKIIHSYHSISLDLLLIYYRASLDLPCIFHI